MGEHEVVHYGRLLTDAGLLERVVENMLVNALDHTPATGRVTIAVTSEKASVQVTVRDTGPGLGLSDPKRLFEPFQQGNPIGRGGGHAGLGLAIAQRIITLHGGQIYANNVPGGGAEFQFILPEKTFK